jgi:hypothetical protein
MICLSTSRNWQTTVADAQIKIEQVRERRAAYHIVTSPQSTKRRIFWELFKAYLAPANGALDIPQKDWKPASKKQAGYEAPNK